MVTIVPTPSEKPTSARHVAAQGRSVRTTAAGASASRGRHGRRHRVRPAAASTSFPAQPAHVSRARRFARLVLDAWGLSADTVDSAALVVGELAANAAQHGGARMTVTLHLAGRNLRIRVLDADFGARPTADDLPTDEHGRGMHIVRALADAVETSMAARATVVTAHMSAERNGSAADVAA